MRRTRSAGSSLAAPERGTRPAKLLSPTALDQSAPQESIGYNIRRADVHMREQFMRMLGSWRIRPVEYSILRLVDSNPSATQAEIADALCIRRQNLVGLVARLERRGWVRRGVDPADHRRQSLLMTAAGANRLVDLIKAAGRMDREITRCWSDAERATLLKLLQRLYNR